MSRTHKIIYCRPIFPILFFGASLSIISLSNFSISDPPLEIFSYIFIFGCTLLMMYQYIFNFCSYDENGFKYLWMNFYWKDIRYISKNFNMIYIDFGDRGILFIPFIVRSFSQNMLEIYTEIRKRKIKVKLNERAREYFGDIDVVLEKRRSKKSRN